MTKKTVRRLRLVLVMLMKLILDSTSWVKQDISSHRPRKSMCMRK